MPPQSTKAAPDGGWGWVLVVGSFYFHLCVSGLYSLGVLYVSWLDDFGAGRGVTSWVIALALALCVLTGPVSATLGNRFGYRVVVMVGAFLMFLGYFLCFFMTNIYGLIASIGGLAGLGMGLCYLPGVATVAPYFDKRRAVAIGICTSGVGVGTFIMPPFVNWLETCYGWRGAMLIMSGINLNVLVCGALIRPLPADNTAEEELEIDVEVVDDDKHPNENGLVTASPRHTVDPGSISQIDVPLVLIDELSQSDISPENRSSSTSGYRSDASKSPSVQLLQTQSGNGSLEKIEDDPKIAVSLAKDLHLQLLKKVYGVKDNKKDMGGSLGNIQKSIRPEPSVAQQFSSAAELRHRSHKSSMLSIAKSIGHPPDQIRTSARNMSTMLAGSIYNILPLQMPKSSIHSIHSLHNLGQSLDFKGLLPGAIESVTVTSEADCSVVATSTHDMPKQPGRISSCLARISPRLQVYGDLMEDSKFVLVAISNFLINLTYVMPILYMVDRAVDANIDKASAAYTLSAYGAGNMFGRVFFGWLADRKLMSSGTSYIICLMVCGVSTSLSPLCGDVLELHALYAVVFGTFIGDIMYITHFTFWFG